MAFKAAFMAHAPDANPSEHRCKIDTGKYVLFVLVVRDQDQAVEESKRLVDEGGVESILLCPGFSNRDVAGIAEAVGEGVSVCVARGDAPGNRIVAEILKREWA